MPDGRMSILDWFIASVGSAEDGVAAYDYPKPGETEKSPKLTYARKFKLWNLLITSGVWIDEADFGVRKVGCSGGALEADLQVLRPADRSDRKVDAEDVAESISSLKLITISADAPSAIASEARKGDTIERSGRARWS